MVAIRVLMVFLAPLLSSAGATLNTGTSEREYALPDHGYFVAQVPRDWKDQVRQPPTVYPLRSYSVKL
jgi:hypothetical protein